MSSARSEVALVRPTIPIRYLAEISDRSRAPARSVRAALAAAALPRSALGVPQLRVSVLQVKAFHEVLRRETGDELFGYFERPVPVGAYATLLRLLTESSHLATALDGFVRFYRIFDHHPYVHVVADGRRTTVSLITRDRDQGRSIFFTHGILLTVWRTLTWLSGRDPPLDDIELPARFRSFASETRYLFGCVPRFGKRAAIAFATSLLREPVARRPDEAERYGTASLEALLSPARGPTLEGELRALFSASSPVAAPTLLETARHLGISRAVLARRLSAEALSFQRLKDDVRRDHAIGLLTGTSLSVAAISERLGYSAPTAFQRAFRGWTGASPGQLRRR
jgi:AraC-like DNA-binding protein